MITYTNCYQNKYLVLILFAQICAFAIVISTDCYYDYWVVVIATIISVLTASTVNDRCQNMN